MDISTGGFLAAIVLGLLLGLRHAADADHVVAVSTIVSEEGNVWRGLWVGASWGLGHTTPLLLLGVVILFLKDPVLSRYEAIAPVLEFGVGIMLVFLGIQVFWRLHQKRLHIHEHLASARPHVHVHAHSPEAERVGDPYQSHRPSGSGKPFFRLKSFVVGIVHGLAGSAAVMLLLLPQAPSFLVGFTYILLFGLSTILSMAGITLVLGTPFVLTTKVASVNRWIVGIAGSLSLLFGLALMSDIALGTHLLEFLPE
jgi:ABC-type nickel/cobalt efflux system permease component RcnA